MLTCITLLDTKQSSGKRSRTDLLGSFSNIDFSETIVGFEKVQISLRMSFNVVFAPDAPELIFVDFLLSRDTHIAHWGLPTHLHL